MAVVFALERQDERGGAEPGQRDGQCPRQLTK
jgi:hypothetical protein